MTRLYRPHIPLEVRFRVAMRQLGGSGFGFSNAGEWPDPDKWIASWKRTQFAQGGLGVLLARFLARLAVALKCEVKDLRLDHDPPLGARPQFRTGLGKTRYEPDANDPAHLFYRPHGPQFAGSHVIKTNVRGDHGQHPDRVLIKRERKRLRKAKKRRGPKIRSRGFDKRFTRKLSGEVVPRKRRR
jgi:hypothetical protein